MKKFAKKICATAASAVCAVSMSISVFAEDVEIDSSGAVQSSGEFGQSLIYYTYRCEPEEYPDNFDPTTMTEDSEILVEYTLDGDFTESKAPLELIFQSWPDGPAENDGEKWAKIAPYEFDENSAAFSYEDIAAAYGTKDFSAVYAINVGDMGYRITVTKMTVTNVGESNIPEGAEAVKADNGDSSGSSSGAGGRINSDGSYEIDVSGAKQSNGRYGQSLSYYTYLGDPVRYADNFDPTIMTDRSDVYVEYTLEGDYETGDDGSISAPPVQLIWQSWAGGMGNSEGDKWIQVAPYEYDDKSASFSFDDIAAAYGTEDFSTVYAINVGDTGVKLTLTKMVITNVKTSSGDSAAETEITETTAAEITLTSAAIVENAPNETSAAPIVMGVVIGVIAVAVIVVVVILTVKKSKGKYY
ncbi:MAG: hypothetical protein NC078_07120 [Ruminococcus sp.]|nr:hypothetical protein [Ruminococcus sp.]